MFNRIKERIKERLLGNVWSQVSELQREVSDLRYRVLSIEDIVPMAGHYSRKPESFELIFRKGDEVKSAVFWPFVSKGEILWCSAYMPGREGRLVEIVEETIKVMDIKGYYLWRSDD